MQLRHKRIRLYSKNIRFLSFQRDIIWINFDNICSHGTNKWSILSVWVRNIVELKKLVEYHSLSECDHILAEKEFFGKDCALSNAKSKDSITADIRSSIESDARLRQWKHFSNFSLLCDLWVIWRSGAKFKCTLT